jgi:ABC-type Fe3+ transport system permease subunit
MGATLLDALANTPSTALGAVFLALTIGLSVACAVCLADR